MEVEPQLLEIYIKATDFAKTSQQTVGEKRDYYITLEQLEGIIWNYSKQQSN